MMLKILEDAVLKPDVFCWFGAIPIHELQVWSQHIGVQLPVDLMDFWRLTGGGDVFESETILRPNVHSPASVAFLPGDDTDSTNASHKSGGMAEHLFVFQAGTFLSAVDTRTSHYVALSDLHSVEATFASFEEWYKHTLRAEFGPRYGLDRR